MNTEEIAGLIGVGWLALSQIASIITAVTNTRDAQWYKVIEAIALVVGKAKQ